jgi:hypothetical protein
MDRLETLIVHPVASDANVHAGLSAAPLLLPPDPQADPLSTVFPLASNFTQSLAVVEPVESWSFAPLP